MSIAEIEDRSIPEIGPQHTRELVGLHIRENRPEVVNRPMRGTSLVSTLVGLQVTIQGTLLVIIWD